MCSAHMVLYYIDLTLAVFDTDFLNRPLSTTDVDRKYKTYCLLCQRSTIRNNSRTDS